MYRNSAITGVPSDGSTFNVQRQRSQSTLASRLPPRCLPSLLFMPHPIVEIDELLRLVIEKLIETSSRAAISFALTCQSLEEPILSSLWEQQYFLPVFVKVLPNPACVRDGHGVDFIVVSDRDSRADRIVNINSPRRLNTILQRRTGPDYNNILPECMDYTSALAELLPAIPFPDSSPIHPMASCSPSGTINLERPHSIQPPALTFFRLFTSSIWDAPPSTTITWFTFQWVS